MVLVIALCAVAAISLAACAGDPLVVSDTSEIAAHRIDPPLIRGADVCVDEISRKPEIGYGDHALITMRVDRAGHVTFVNAEPLDLATFGLRNLASTDCQRQIALAIEGWRYRSFERNGRAIDAEIVERVLFLPAERWRTTSREFPQVSLDSVVITLERWPGLFVCEGDRSAWYVLQIRGTGEGTMAERVHNNVPGGPIFVDAPARHFTIGRDTVERLVEQFRVANFFSLEEEYASGITDQPGQRLTFETNTDRAEVLDYVGETVGMPMVVRDLQLAVDAAAGVEPLRCGADMWLQAN
jgi:hypothetical protein